MTRNANRKLTPASQKPKSQVLGRWSSTSKNGASWDVLWGDAAVVLAEFEPAGIQCVVTSPPYYSQRDYGVAGQIGLEKTIDEYVDRLASAFDEVRRVLAPDGTLFLNLGDTYYSGKGQPKGHDRKNAARRFGLRPVDAGGLGVPRKSAIGIPWRVALAMIERGWTLRCPIVWTRKTPIPEPTARDRPWRSYEMLFLFSRSSRYYFQRDGLGSEEDIWAIGNPSGVSRGIHSATFPDELVRRCLGIGCPAGGKVLDPFAGSGTVARVALESGRSATSIDLNESFCRYIVRSLEAV